MVLKKDKLYQDALDYHQSPNGPGKITIAPTKALVSQRDLALAYSPGVAAPCEEIAADPKTAALYTARGNLVAVITNGTAVLGLGDIGPLAAKPVMEGKAVLFQKFAGIDAIDLEIDEKNPDKLVEIIAALEPSFGGINLEDIKAPECFYIEKKLRERMNIPVFHDDQHGTAIICAAGIINACDLTGRKLSDVKLVLNGAGVRTRFFFRVYVGALYLPQKSAAAPAIIQDAGARRIALHMLRELSAEQFIGALEDGLQKNHAADELAKLNPRVQQLRAIFEAVKTAKPGDVIFIDYLPGTGTRITVNGAVQGMIAGEDFNRALLRIWLGDSPADSDLKKGMLGG